MATENLRGLIANIDLIDQTDACKLFAYMIGLFKARSELNRCLHNLNSKEWMILYKAVLEVEAGL